MSGWGVAGIRTRATAMCALALTQVSAAIAGGDPLTVVEKTISARFVVDEVLTRELAAALSSADSSSYLVFDVREPDEYERSHVRRARRLAPDTKLTAFEAEFGDSLAGKRLVFYCSVGYRSSILAERVLDSAKKSGAVSVANLRGGIFRWYNDGRTVYDAADTTDQIHPYDRVWGAFVNQRLLAPAPPTPAPADGSEK